MVINHIYFISKHYAKCKFALKFIQFVFNPNLFILEDMQKSHHADKFWIHRNGVSNETNTCVHIYIEEHYSSSILI